MTKSWEHPDEELQAVAKSLEDTGRAEYKGFTIYPAPDYGYEVQGEDDQYETLIETLNSLDQRTIN